MTNTAVRETVRAINARQPYHRTSASHIVTPVKAALERCNDFVVSRQDVSAH